MNANMGAFIPTMVGAGFVLYRRAVSFRWDRYENNLGNL